MQSQPEHSFETPNYPLVGWTSLIAAGAIIVIWKAGSSLNLHHDSIGTFLSLSFLAVEQIAATLVYRRAEKQRLMYAFMVMFFIPVCIIAIMLVGVFADEFIYGAGYH